MNKAVKFAQNAVKSFSMRRDWIYLFFGLLAVAAAWMLKYDMAWGPWAFSDSAAYISAARNLVAGHGLSVSTPQGGFQPLTLHQPLYPLVLSFFLLFDIHPFTTSVVINIASFSLSLLIFSSGIYYFSRSKLLAICCSLLFFVSPNLIVIYDGAMSEPLYLFLTISAFFATMLYIEKQRIHLLVLAAILVGLSILTRYIGIANLFFGAVVIFIFIHADTRIRFRKSITFSGIALLPVLIWILPGIISSNQNSRSWRLPADIIQNVKSFIVMLFETFTDWLPFKKQYALNQPTELIVVIVLFSITAILFLSAIRIRQKTTNHKLTNVANLIFSAGLYALFYLVVFYAAFAFSSLPPDVNTRTMIPLLPFIILLMTSLLYYFTIRTNLTLLMPLALILTTTWIISSNRISHVRRGC